MLPLMRLSKRGIEVGLFYLRRLTLILNLPIFGDRFLSE